MLPLASGALGHGPAGSGPSLAGTSSGESSLGATVSSRALLRALMVRVLASGRRVPPVSLTQWTSSLFSLCQEKAMAPRSSALAWKIPRTEEPGGLRSRGSLRVGHDRATSLSLFTFMHWRRKWQPTPVFLPGESQGWWGLVGCRLWGLTESDTTEATQQQQQCSLEDIRMSSGCGARQAACALSPDCAHPHPQASPQRGPRVLRDLTDQTPVSHAGPAVWL